MGFINELNAKKKRIMNAVIGVAVSAIFIISFSVLYLTGYDRIIYTNNNLHFYKCDGEYVVFSDEFAGIYTFNDQGDLLELKTPISGYPHETISFDKKEKTISGIRYKPYKRYNFDLELNSLFKKDLLSMTVDNISEKIKDIKKYNNLSWFAIQVIDDVRKGARIVDEKENPLFIVLFSVKGDIESFNISNSPENAKIIKSLFDISRIKKLSFNKTALGNEVFYARDGTIVVIKNKVTGEIEKFEIRLYGSSGSMYNENFFTDFENAQSINVERR